MDHSRFKRGSLAAVLPIAALGCATIINGKSQTVRIDTTPAGANVTVLPDRIQVTSPTEVELARKIPHTLLVEIEGLDPRICYIERMTSGAIYWNIVFGGLIGLAVDTSSGGAFRLVPDEISVELPAAVDSTPVCY